MEKILLWLFLILGLILLKRSLSKPPLKNWLLCFLTAAYFAIFSGDLIVRYEMISYPVKLLPQIQSSVLYEYLLLPLVCVYFYQTSFHKGVLGWCLQSLAYSCLLTAAEVLLELNTNLVHYITWNGFYSLVSLFLFLIFIRWMMWLVNDVAERRGRSQGE